MDAMLNITWNGQNGSLKDHVFYESTEGDIKNWATEAVRAGSIPGIAADPNVNFADFVVDRYDPKDDLPARLMLRPKTPFGA
jgi:hypothetical protein